MSKEYVYFIKDSGGLIKIGKSVDIAKRFKSYQLHNPSSVLLYTSGNLNEREVHDKFKMYRIANTEWFNPDDEIYLYIEGCKKVDSVMNQDLEYQKNVLLTNNHFNISNQVAQEPVIVKENLNFELHTQQKLPPAYAMTPNEVDKIIKVIPRTSPHLRTIFNLLLYTGMRYIEIRRLFKHPEWLNESNNVIHLPREASIGSSRSTPERYVPISLQLIGEMPYFFMNKCPPHHKVWGENLKRWSIKSGLNIDIVPKSTRTTLISWMFAADYPTSHIGHLMGISSLLELESYKLIEFNDSDKKEIKRRIGDWR